MKDSFKINFNIDEISEGLTDQAPLTTVAKK